MTLQECYALFGGSYEDVSSRLPRERMIEKFMLRFLDDASFSQLQKNLLEKDMEEAFRASHTLKGVAANLGFASLTKSASELTELLRSQNPDYSDAYDAVCRDYEQVRQAIESYKAAAGGQ